MVLGPYQMGYFITQVGLSAASFGVAPSDIKAAAGALEKLFDSRCAPKTTVIPKQGAYFQSICTAKNCPLFMNGTCAHQPALPQPIAANASLADGEGRKPSSSSSASATPSPTMNAAGRSVPGVAGLLSVFAAILTL